MNLSQILESTSNATVPLAAFDAAIADNDGAYKAFESYGKLLKATRRLLKRDYLTRPLDRDGKPIVFNQKYYGGDGCEWLVVGLLENSTYNVLIHPYGIPRALRDGDKPAKSQWLSRTEPDSFEQIIEDARKRSAAINIGGNEFSDWEYSLDELEQRLKNLGRWSK